MITKFKIFEENNDGPQIGDYVICNELYGEELSIIYNKFNF